MQMRSADAGEAKRTNAKKRKTQLKKATLKGAKIEMQKRAKKNNISDQGPTGQTSFRQKVEKTWAKGKKKRTKKANQTRDHLDKHVFSGKSCEILGK